MSKSVLILLSLQSILAQALQYLQSTPFDYKIKLMISKLKHYRSQTPVKMLHTFRDVTVHTLHMYTVLKMQ